MVKKALSFALAAIAGCVALVPQGTIPGVLSGTEASSQPTGVVGTSGSSSTPTNQPTEPKTPSPSATAGQSATPLARGTPAPSTLPSATHDTSATPSPSQSPSSNPASTPTVTPAPTSAPYAVSIAIEPSTQQTIFLKDPAGNSDGLQQIGPVTIQFLATVTMSDGSTNSTVIWSVSHTSLATVSADGLVEGIKPTGVQGAVVIATAVGNSGIYQSTDIEVKSGGLANIIVQ